MNKRILIVNALIPAFFVLFRIFGTVGDLDDGNVQLILLVSIPIVMFLYNTLSESELKKLALTYFVSTGFQILRIFVEFLIYIAFISNDSESAVVCAYFVLFTALFNLLLSLIGLGIRKLISKI